jgi:hypothetical protein
VPDYELLARARASRELRGGPIGKPVQAYAAVFSANPIGAMDLTKSAAFGRVKALADGVDRDIAALQADRSLPDHERLARSIERAVKGRAELDALRRETTEKLSTQRKAALLAPDPMPLPAHVEALMMAQLHQLDSLQLGAIYETTDPQTARVIERLPARVISGTDSRGRARLPHVEPRLKDEQREKRWIADMPAEARARYENLGAIERALTGLIAAVDQELIRQGGARVLPSESAS